MMRTPSLGRLLSLPALLVLSACGGVDPTPDLDVEDFGGPNGLMQFFEDHTDEEIRQTLASYGVGYRVHGTDTAELISDCPKFLPSADRTMWHNFDGEHYYIDDSGRPSLAYKDLPPVVAAPRLESCQTAIGQWGDVENPKNDYDGGHLIGSQLGGWGGRANIVPQNANFNRGNWAQIENKMAGCGKLPSGQLRYSIRAEYPNSSALVPSALAMEITNQSTNDSIILSFQNVDSGGKSGKIERKKAVAWLSDQGCD
jgi:hypothetical protein